MSAHSRLSSFSGSSCRTAWHLRPQRTRSCAVAFSTGSFSLTTEPRVMAAQFSQDPLFEGALDAMPVAMSSGLRSAGLADPGLPDAYPRDSFEELVAAGVTGDESRERVDMNAGILAADVVGSGGGPGNTTVATVWTSTKAVPTLARPLSITMVSCLFSPSFSSSFPCLLLSYVCPSFSSRGLLCRLTLHGCWLRCIREV